MKTGDFEKVILLSGNNIGKTEKIFSTEDFDV
jgi:hypothetical protein